MLNAQVQSNPSCALTSLPKPFLKGNTLANFLDIKRSNKFPSQNRKYGIGLKPNKTMVSAVLISVEEKQTTIKTSLAEQQTKVTATITIHPLSSTGIDLILDLATDLLGRALRLELFSAELDPNGQVKPTISAYAHKVSKDESGDLKFEAEFEVPLSFGDVGAVYVENKHHRELYLKDIQLEGFFSIVTVTCNSWIHSKFDKNKKTRFFFTDKSYLPSETPNALVSLREQELMTLRGTGQGECKEGDRVYDYDVYNDLGCPEDGEDLVRPILGGNENPYPRRCRTGRLRSRIDPNYETRCKGFFYVPRDEEFLRVKGKSFGIKALDSALHALIPALEGYFQDKDDGFPYFTAIDSLYNEGIDLPPPDDGRFGDLLPNFFKYIIDKEREILKFETPSAMERDKFFWLKDEEFARETLAGLNPCKLELVTEWPLTSSLDPTVYGPPESAITTEMVEGQLRGFEDFVSVEEALEQKKLFMLDYHDLFLPFVCKVRELKNTTLYGSRSLFYLTSDSTLTPVAIELVRPPMDGKPQWKEAYTPSRDATDGWIWRLAKAHVLTHDSGYHQLISHWLRTHCCAEPYIIAANRQLSEMHPIYRLLHPHFRYTMEMNALARKSLINAGGTIESCFTPGKYSMLLSSVIYDKEWRFDYQALPNDLISRGLAVEDQSAPHGLKLAIEDYPYANDGLELWDIIKDWASDYVNYYYPDPSILLEDEELQAWWDEVRNVGHGDKKDESWWPELKTPADLIEILSTIMWTTSGLHAAVNFGQYAYAGYFPNRPTIARINMPTEDPTQQLWNFFLEKPEAVLLSTFPTQLQAIKTMAVMDILSDHSPDEEYIGQEIEPAWGEEPQIRASFEKFYGSLLQLAGTIDERNAQVNLKNRNGAGVMPYELLKPSSNAGDTGKGVPYSISI